MSAGKGDKPRPVNKARYDLNYTTISWKSRSSRKTAEDCAKNKTEVDANKNPCPDASCRKS